MFPAMGAGCVCVGVCVCVCTHTRITSMHTQCNFQLLVQQGKEGSYKLPVRR